MIENPPFPHGLTVDGGRFRLERLLRGNPHDGLWLASSLPTKAHNVLVTMRRLRYSRERDALLRYSAPGIPEPLYVGPPDKFDDEEYEHARHERLCVVDEQPAGINLTIAGLLTLNETIDLGISLCDVIDKWASARDGFVTRGLRPETIYVDGPVGQQKYSGATPRTFFLLGNDGASSPYPYLDFDPPAASIFEMPPSDALFTIAAILWHANTGSHPYAMPGTNTYKNIWDNRRVPFPGPHALGAVLEKALVGYEEPRISPADFVEHLQKIREGQP